MREHLVKSVIVVDRLRIRTIDRDCDDEPINKIKVKYVLYLRCFFSHSSSITFNNTLSDLFAWLFLNPDLTSITQTDPRSAHRAAGRNG